MSMNRVRLLARSVRTSVHVAVVAGVVMSLGVPGAAGAAAEPKTIVKCQATLKKSGAKFIAKKLAALAKCTNGVLKCIQTVDETADGGAKRTACIEKARTGCLKSLGAIKLQRQDLVGAITKACATLDPAQVTGGAGLGYTSLDCSEFSAPVTNVATMAECIAEQHDCLAGEMFQLQVPRVLEMIQFTPPDAVDLPPADLEGIACLDDLGGNGADVGDVKLGKGIVKCQKTIEKTGAKLASKRLKSLEKCVDALFKCAQTESGADLVACREKARAGCEKGFAKDSDQSAALVLGIEKTCGDAALFAAFRTAAGGNLEALTSASSIRTGIILGCSPLVTLADYRACLLAEIKSLIDKLMRFQAPRAEPLLDEVGCTLGECGPAPPPSGITQIMSAAGDGVHPLDAPVELAVDGVGTVYVVARNSDNAFKITSGGTITQIISATGDGTNSLDVPTGMAVEAGGTAYVAGSTTNNAFKITPGGTITEIISGDDVFLAAPISVAVDGSNSTAYVVGASNETAYKIPLVGMPTFIISAPGDGVHALDTAGGIAVDGMSNAYVTGFTSNNVFKITSAGMITQILDATGDGAGNPLQNPFSIAASSDGTVYVTSFSNDKVFKITSGGMKTQIITATGDGAGHALDQPTGLAVDGDGNVYVGGSASDNAFKITPAGMITQLIDASGDGMGHALDRAEGIAVDGQGNVFVSGRNSDNVFKISP